MTFLRLRARDIASGCWNNIDMIWMRRTYREVYCTQVKNCRTICFARKSSKHVDELLADAMQWRDEGELDNALKLRDTWRESDKVFLMANRQLVASLRGMLALDRRKWSPAIAEYVLSWKFSPRDLRRMRALAAKANEGALTPAEFDEMEAFSDLAHLVGTAQARARQIPRRKATAA